MPRAGVFIQLGRSGPQGIRKRGPLGGGHSRSKPSRSLLSGNKTNPVPETHSTRRGRAPGSRIEEMKCRGYNVTLRIDHLLCVGALGRGQAGGVPSRVPPHVDRAAPRVTRARCGENLFGGWMRSRDTVGDAAKRRSNEPCSGATGRVQKPFCARSTKSQASDIPPNRF